MGKDYEAQIHWHWSGECCAIGSHQLVSLLGLLSDSLHCCDSACACSEGHYFKLHGGKFPFETSEDGVDKKSGAFRCVKGVCVCVRLYTIRGQVGRV